MTCSCGNASRPAAASQASRRCQNSSAKTPPSAKTRAVSRQARSRPEPASNRSCTRARLGSDTNSASSAATSAMRAGSPPSWPVASSSVAPAGAHTARPRDPHAPPPHSPRIALARRVSCGGGGGHVGVTPAPATGVAASMIGPSQQKASECRTDAACRDLGAVRSPRPHASRRTLVVNVSPTSAGG